MTDMIAERVRKLGGTTIRSIGHIKRLQRVLDNDADYVTPLDMIAELREDNATLAARLVPVRDHPTRRSARGLKRGRFPRKTAIYAVFTSGT